MAAAAFAGPRAEGGSRAEQCLLCSVATDHDIAEVPEGTGLFQCSCCLHMWHRTCAESCNYVAPAAAAGSGRRKRCFPPFPCHPTVDYDFNAGKFRCPPCVAAKGARVLGAHTPSDSD